MTREEVIDAIYNEYMRIRSLTQYGKEDENAYKQISKEGGAADMCIALKADPKLYVKAIHKYKPSVAPFNGNVLISKTVGQWYQKLADEANEIDNNTFDVQLQYVVGAIRGGRTLKSVLLDPHLQLEPWFRVVVSKEPIKEVIEKFSSAAKDQLTERVKKIITSKNLDIQRIYEPRRYL